MFLFLKNLCREFSPEWKEIASDASIWESAEVFLFALMYENKELYAGVCSNMHNPQLNLVSLIQTVTEVDRRV